MPRTALRRIAAVVSVAILLLGGVALPAAAAKGGKGHGRGHSVERVVKAKGKSASKRQQGRNKVRSHKVRVVRFAGSGVVTAVSPATSELWVEVKGGTKNVRRDLRLFDVTNAKINRNDEAATVADLVVGDHVAVKGVVEGGLFVAKRANAEGEVVLDEPVEETTTTDPADDTTTTDPADDTTTTDPIEDVPVA